MYQCQFQPVLNAMIEPQLRLIVTVSKGRLDDPYYIEITFDPLLEKHRMSMPMPEQYAALWSMWNKSPPPPVVFESGRQEKMASFFVQDVVRDGSLELTVGEYDRSLSFDSRLVDKCAPLLRFQDFGILPATLEASLELPEWDCLARASKLSNGDEIAMFIGPHTARRFASAGFISKEGLTDSATLFRQRVVRSVAP